MSSESIESGRIGAPLADLARKGADVAQIADALVSTLQKIDAALSPIIGQGGVAALYRRSLYVTGQAHPWLAGTHEGIHTAVDLSALKSQLVQQTSVKAAAGGDALLQTFYKLLASLVGPSLTERLLRSVWANDFTPTGGGTSHHDN
jgi:hypothetical protein